MIAMLIAAAVYLALLGLMELIVKSSPLSKDVSRRIIHITAGVISALLPRYMSFDQIAFLSSCFVAIICLSIRYNVFSSMHGVRRHTYGEIYFPLGVLVTALFFPNVSQYVYGVLVLGISDALASIIGQRYGIRKFRRLLCADKSYAGSAAFFASAVLIGFVILALAHASLIEAFLFSLLMAGVLTIVEGKLTDGEDNLWLCPVAAGLILTAMNLFVR